MNVEREKDEFKPVTIVLETEEELIMFHALIKALYYSREVLEMVNKNFFFDRFVYKFMDTFLPKLEQIMKSHEKKS